MRGDADRLAQREAESVGWNRIYAPEDFGGKATIVFEAGGNIRDIVFRFDDRLASIAAFDFRKLGAVLADFFR